MTLDMIDDDVIFGISLKAATLAVDWQQVQRNLAATLASIGAANHPSARVVVAGHERPDEVTGDFEFLAAPFTPPKDVLRGSGDKFRKRRMIGAWMRERCSRHARIMFLDADDLVHRDLTAHVVASDPALSHSIEQGYRYDAVERLLERVDEGFWRYCGSCFVGAFTRDDLPRDWEDEATLFTQIGAKSHVGHVDRAEAAGRPVAQVPFPAAVYLLNHGDSLDFAKKGRKKLFDRPAIADEDAQRILRDDFGVDRPAATAAPAQSEHRQRFRERKARSRARQRAAEGQEQA